MNFKLEFRLVNVDLVLVREGQNKPRSIIYLIRISEVHYLISVNCFFNMIERPLKMAFCTVN